MVTFTTIILTAAKKVGIPGSLLLAICTHESNLKNVVSPNDGGTPTYGICQVKYETAKMLGFKGKPLDLMNPEINAHYAARYIKYQTERYGDDWHMLAASYNAGSYNPSTKVKGCPRNLKYLHKVQSVMEPELRYKLQCKK